MSQSNQDSDIFAEDSTEEEGEVNVIVSETNDIITHLVPQELNVIATILGLSSYNIEPLEQNSLPELPRISRRQDEYVPAGARKYLRSDTGKRIVSKQTPLYSYLRLKSGEEFIFTEDDGNKLLLKERHLDNKLIRNIISRIPFKMSERLDYLAKFDSEEESESEDSEEENAQKVERRYFGNLKDLVYEAYIKEWRLRHIFKRILNLWRVYKMDKTCNKEIDPITLAPFEKKISVYDWDNKTKFLFEAKSIANLIESQLTYQEYAFPVPMNPKNPLNNVEFSYKHLISIYNQLKEYGELKWGLITLRQYNFNKQRWHTYHKSALTVNAIKVSITLLDSLEARDLFSDFIFSKMDELKIPQNQYILTAYTKAIAKIPNHWYLEKFKSLAIKYYEGEHFGYFRTRAINNECQKIFRRQNQFIKDLQNKKII